MNWDAIGAVGEIVGAAAVVLTLIYLAIQIRHGARATQAASREAMSHATIDFLMQMSGDEEKTSFWRRALTNPETLNADELFRRDMIAYAVTESWEMAYSQWQRGVLSEVDWDKWDGVIATYMAAPGFQEFWGASERETSSVGANNSRVSSNRPPFLIATEEWFQLAEFCQPKTIGSEFRIPRANKTLAVFAVERIHYSDP